MLEKDWFSLIKTLKEAQNKKFVFLLIGRTGVGKSSTVNSLMGQQVAPVGAYDPTTMQVESFEGEIDGIKFTIIDTPGLCDDLPENGNDRKYIELILSKVKQVDCLWFVTRLDDSRVTSDEMRGIKIISEAFNSKIWERAVIIFTRANKADDYLVDLQARTKRIRDEIAKHTGVELANDIPSVAVDNKNETTPDGNRWLAELYTKVFVRISEKGTMPFFLATSQRINGSSKNQSKKNQKKVNQGKDYQSGKDPNWSYYNNEPQRDEPWEHKHTNQEFEFNERQQQEIKNKMFAVAPILEKIGETIGSVLGGSSGQRIGQSIGGLVGHAIDFVGSLFGWF